jgi:hypothetical protein
MSTTRKSAKAAPKTAAPKAAPAAPRTNPFSAVDSTRQSAETVVNIGSKAVKELHSSITTEAQKTQEKIYAMGREGAQTFSRSADMASKTMNEVAAIARDNVEACMECGNLSASVAKNVSEEVSEIVNQSLTDAMEICQEALACRTLNDVVELNNRVVKSSLDNCFEQISKLSSIMFEAAAEVCEPINERVSNASNQLSKLMAK